MVRIIIPSINYRTNHTRKTSTLYNLWSSKPSIHLLSTKFWIHFLLFTSGKEILRAKSLVLFDRLVLSGTNQKNVSLMRINKRIPIQLICVLYESMSYVKYGNLTGNRICEECSKECADGQDIYRICSTDEAYVFATTTTTTTL